MATQDGYYPDVDELQAAIEAESQYAPGTTAVGISYACAEPHGRTAQAHAIPVSVEYDDTFGDVDDDGDGDAYIMAYTTDDAERMRAALQIAESDICRANALYAADALQAQLASDNADALHMAAIWEYPQYHAREA